MGEAARKVTVTFAEYLAQEEKAETKHEYLNGEIFAMSGGTLEHAQIAVNLARVLGNLLLDRPCRVFNSDARVRVLATGLGTYPDLSVVCGKIERDPEDRNSMTNPILLVEVLSPSTSDYDRGEKFAHYMKIPSLREYLLVSSDRKRVEIYRRNDEEEVGSWRYRDARDAGVIELKSIDCKLSLDEIYRRVFEEKPAG